MIKQMKKVVDHNFKQIKYFSLVWMQVKVIKNIILKKWFLSSCTCPFIILMSLVRYIYFLLYVFLSFDCCVI